MIIGPCSVFFAVKQLAKQNHIPASDPLLNRGLESAITLTNAAECGAAALAWLDGRALELELEVFQAVCIQPLLLLIAQADLERLGIVRLVDQPVRNLCIACRRGRLRIVGR